MKRKHSEKGKRTPHVTTDTAKHSHSSSSANSSAAQPSDCHHSTHAPNSEMNKTNTTAFNSKPRLDSNTDVDGNLRMNTAHIDVQFIARWKHKRGLSRQGRRPPQR